MADRGDTDRLAVVSMNDVAGRRTHRPWRSRATDARSPVSGAVGNDGQTVACAPSSPRGLVHIRSEEHTSELQSRGQIGCRLLLEIKTVKKKKYYIKFYSLKGLLKQISREN